jgi:hypothetical protein
MSRVYAAPAAENADELRRSIADSPMSLDIALDYITKTLRYTMESPVCTNNLFVAMHRVQDELSLLSLPKKLKLAKSQPQLIRAIIGFLTRKRTPSDFSKLMEHCTRPCHQCKEEEDYPGPELQKRTDLYALTGTIWLSIQMLEMALTGMTKGGFRSVHSSQSGDSQPWPLSPEDLLPFGIKDSMNMLGAWAASEIGGYKIWTFAAALARFYDPFADAAIDAPDFAFRRPLTMLTSMMDLYEKHPAKYRSDLGSLESAIEATFTFWYPLLFRPQFKTALKAMRSMLCPVLQRISGLLPSLSFADPQQRRQIEDGIATFTSMAEGGQEPQLQINYIASAYGEMVTARKGGCGCAVCPLSHDVVPAPRCTGCDIVRFCSQEVSDDD